MKMPAKRLSTMNVLRSMLGFGATILFVAMPSFGQKPDRSRPPELGEPAPLRLPAIQRFTLANGLPVVLMEKHGVPIVQVNLLVKTGSAMDPAGQTGLASLTAAMMDEGAGTRSALELADAIDFLGARISTFAGQHTSVVLLHAPVSKLGEALPLMADIALRPTFPKEELDRLRKERLTTLAQWHDRPSTIASVAFSKTIFGPRHPYGIPTMGNEKSLRAFRVTDLSRFHKTYFHPNNSILIVVGDVSRGSIQQTLEGVFASWTGGTTASVNWPDIQQVENRMVYLVDKPGAAQSEVRIGRVGVTRMTEDYFPLIVMNTILGGAFTSRLNQNLRETHGYSYGAGSVFDMRPLPGPFVAYSAVQTNATDKALGEFMKELNGILRPVSDEELTKAKNYLALGYPDNFESVGQIAGMLADMVLYNLPDDYFNTYVERVLAVSKDDVTRAAKKYIDPEKVAIVVVGDRKEIEKGIRGLKLGKLENLTIEDVLGKPPKL
ncbi:MAG: insulinase family protein [Ignavibacteriales bacterium]|nr:insulinase family protein [Ignavibacteriales bacterium]